MKKIRSIAGKIFAIWAILIFVPTMLVFFPLIWISGVFKEPRRTAIFHFLTRIWMRVFFFFTGTRLRIKGRRNFVKGENYIVISNHNSFMDIPLTTPFLPGPNKTIAKMEMAKIPVFGLIYTRGSVLVDRKSEDSRKTSFIRMRDVLAAGLHMVIYPEGTRNKTSEPLQYFHNGAFKLAVDTGKSILPTILFNTAKVLPANEGFFFWPVRVRMHFLPPISPIGKTVEQLKDESFEVMRKYFVENNH